MNYRKIYENLIISRHYERLCRDLDWYQSRGSFNDHGFEVHHIKPKCIGGSDEPSNLIPLTPREHFIAHWLLAKIHSDNEKLVYAFHSMCRSNLSQVGRKENSKSYEYGRRMLAQVLSSKFKGKKNPKHSERMKGKKNPMFGRHHSELSNDSNRQKHLGLKASADTRLKMSISAKKSENSGRFKKGQKMQESTRIKCTTGYVCEHCGIETGLAVHKRYHGDNCLKNPNRPLEEIIESRKKRKK